jgi:hypothetical protein
MAINTNKEEFISPHSLDNGAKLMEHSWIGNRFVEAVELLLTPEGRWYKDSIVWCGDYADPRPGLTWTDQDTGKVNEANWYSYIDSLPHAELTQLVEAIGKQYNYIVNYTKKLYVDKSKLPIEDIYKGIDENGKEFETEYKIHPLPLLTADGNGRGGGDFRGDDLKEIVGSWAYDSIGIEETIPHGFTELMFNLKE